MVGQPTCKPVEEVTAACAASLVKPARSSDIGIGASGAGAIGTAPDTLYTHLMSEALPFEAPRKWSRGIPVTGAWLEGDPVGDRRFHSLTAERPFALEGGGVLHEATIAYETWGELNEAADNAVLVCHALTGDAHASGGVSAVHPDGGWWDGVIGPGRAIDTDRWFVVCANVLGGCQGSTGPASTNPETGKP